MGIESQSFINPTFISGASIVETEPQNVSDPTVSNKSEAISNLSENVNGSDTIGANSTDTNVTETNTAGLDTTAANLTVNASVSTDLSETNQSTSNQTESREAINSTDIAVEVFTIEAYVNDTSENTNSTELFNGTADTPNNRE